ncbi:MAG: peptidylprolyl isomerase, partial [Marivirga sp.]|nr:peptidylprolyl isomerase [Marivirga sp.]
MDKLNRVVLNFIFCIQVLLLFLLFVEDSISLPAWLQVAGRMHPLILHLPIGIMIFLVVLVLVQKEFDRSAARQIIQTGLLLTSLSASLAALFGFFLSLQSDYGADVLMRHKVSGVLLSFLCYAVLLWFNANQRKSVFFGLGVITVFTLVFTGHTGSVLTHGDNFLFAPISEPEVILTAENASVYKYAVEPILERKCFSCHNESKAKGKLVMTSIEKFVAGGENGKPWIEGNPSESRMIKAFYLPLDHDEHMPPDGKPQLTQFEIATLKAWIKSGADFEKKMAELPDGDSLKFMVTSIAASQQAQPEQEVYDFDAASEDVISKLNTPFRTVFPLYQNSPALQADFFVRKSFDVKALEELKTVAEQLVVLNLSKMPVTDKDLS